MENEENKIENESKELALVKAEGTTEAGTQILTQTTIQDKKQVFNIENGECDIKLNDIVGENITICDIFMKRIISNLPEDEIELNEETGEVIKDKKVSVVTILVDKEGDRYVTASKIFAMSILNLIRVYGIEEIQKGVEIKIIKKSVSNSSNKALGFELI
jgi:hypothetical protein